MCVEINTLALTEYICVENLVACSFICASRLAPACNLFKAIYYFVKIYNLLFVLFYFIIFNFKLYN